MTTVAHCGAHGSSLPITSLTSLFACALFPAAGLISSFTDTEKEIVSVERTVEYIGLRGEDELDDEPQEQQSQRSARGSDADLDLGDEEAPHGRKAHLRLTTINRVRTRAHHLPFFLSTVSHHSFFFPSTECFQD